MDEPRPAGRPTLYTEELANEIVMRLADGESLNSICKQPNMPTRQTVFNWIVDNRSGFFDKYTRSKDIQIDGYVDELLDWCNSGLGDPALVQAIKLKVDTLKWIASKLKPKKYGDRTEVEHSGGIVHTHKPDLSKLSTAELKALESLVNKVESSKD